MADDKQTSKDAFDRITNPDGTPVRDKDNASRDHKPNYAAYPAPNLAPPGMSGIRQSQPRKVDPEPSPKPYLTFESRFESDTHRYLTGHLTDAPHIGFMARVCSTLPEKPLANTNVDQLVLKQNGEAFVRHNFVAKDLDLYPQTSEQERLMDRICQELDGGRRQSQTQQRPSESNERDPQSDKIDFRRQKDDRIDFRAKKSDLVPTREGSPREAGLVIDKSFESRSDWVKGRIIAMPGYSFTAKVFDKPSKFGIENGQISKLEIRKNGRKVVNYDRGWDQRPQTGAQIEAVERVRQGLETVRPKEIKAPDKPSGKDQGMGR